MTSAPRTLLLVDDEPNIISALRRALRTDGYSILTADSAEEGLRLLSEKTIHVILSDQRMPRMNGTDFLRKVKELHPKTIRLVLSGYTDLESVTSAINEGAIYKFLTKPWDDKLLRDNIRDAFEHYEMERENLRLTHELEHANTALFRLNQNLQHEVMLKTREIMHNINMLKISQEILEHLPVAILGIDEHGMIAVTNRRAEALFSNSCRGCLLGLEATECLPEPTRRFLRQPMTEHHENGNPEILHLANGGTMQVWVSQMGESSRSKGTIFVISPIQ